MTTMDLYVWNIQEGGKELCNTGYPWGEGPDSQSTGVGLCRLFTT